MVEKNARRNPSINENTAWTWHTRPRDMHNISYYVLNFWTCYCCVVVIVLVIMCRPLGIRFQRLWWNHRRPTKKQQCTCWELTTHRSIVPLLHCCVSVTFVSLGHLVGMRWCPLLRGFCKINCHCHNAYTVCLSLLVCQFASMQPSNEMNNLLRCSLPTK
jgi:hypothetical protein